MDVERTFRQVHQPEEVPCEEPGEAAEKRLFPVAPEDINSFPREESPYARALDLDDIDALDRARRKHEPCIVPCKAGASFRWTHAHVGDAAYAVVLAAEGARDGVNGVFNVGEPETPTMRSRAHSRRSADRDSRAACASPRSTGRRSRARRCDRGCPSD